MQCSHTTHFIFGVWMLYVVGTNHSWNVDICLCLNELVDYGDLCVLAGEEQWCGTILEVKNIPVITHNTAILLVVYEFNC